ncbi:MAG: VTT domain-containing protein [Candidatus Yonathbacteria bacterium]|nr:VTT domain-containing protein [Candidatus Yonathbacteria bacterium]
MFDFLHFDLMALIQTIGYLGIFAIVFAESGLFFGFFFPGDSLLFTAGLLASQGFLNIWVFVALVIMGAILGDSVGYWFGAKAGPKIFTREDSFFFHKRHVERTHNFYLKYGAKAIVLARFIPIVRTFTPILAGVGTMPYGTFLKWNIIGGVLWGAGVTLLGYFLGAVIPGIERYLLPIVAGIIIVSFLPLVSEFVKNRKKEQI